MKRINQTEVSVFGKEHGMKHSEKLYNTISFSGVIGIVAGSIAIVTGIATGVIMIVSGAKLLLRRKEVLI